MTLASLTLVLLLAACGGVGSTASATPTAPPPTATPTPTATSVQAQQVQTYTGDGFTIKYPQGWTVQNVQGAIVFTDAQKLNTVTITVIPNPGGTVSAAKQNSAGMALVEKSVTNPQPVSLPATTTLAGATWVQSGVTGTVSTNGVTGPAEIIGLATNHPDASPSTKTYEIYYAGPTLTFTQENQLIFQPMLQTFAFSA